MKITESVEVLKPLIGPDEDYIRVNCRMSDDYSVDVEIYVNEIEISQWEDGEITDFISIKR